MSPLRSPAPRGPATPPRPAATTATTIKQATERLAALLHDEAAWLAAAERAAEAERWVWTAAGAQLGRVGPGHRRHDPAAEEPVLLDEPPERPGDEELYGLDAAGDVVVHRDWLAGAGPRLHAYDRSGPGLLIRRWAADGDPAGLELVVALPDGRLTHTVDMNAAGETFAERYLWAENSGPGGTRAAGPAVAGGAGEVRLRAVELLAVSSSTRPRSRRVRVTDRVVY